MADLGTETTNTSSASQTTDKLMKACYYEARTGLQTGVQAQVRALAPMTALVWALPRCPGAQMQGDRYVDVHAEGVLAFRSACAMGCLDVVRLLLSLEGDRLIDVHAEHDAAFKTA